jgi:hypothetical protein
VEIRGESRGTACGAPTFTTTYQQTYNRAMSPWLRHLFSRENALAVAVCLMLILLVVLTSGDAPRWIYQGF